MSTNTSAVVKAADSKPTVRQYLNSPQFAEQVAKALPKHLTPDRFIRVALTAMTKTPKLAECTQASLFSSLLTLSQFGLEPDGRRAHLIPYGKECTLVLDYKGLAELAYRSGLVSYLHADVVCDKDDFEYSMGEIVKHKINFREDRGEMYAAYSICRFKDGTTKAEVMSLEDILAIKARSKSGNNGPWVTDFREMAKKTVFKRLSKWLPLSAEFRDAVEVDNDAIDIETTEPRERLGMAAMLAQPEDSLPSETLPEQNAEATSGATQEKE